MGDLGLCCRSLEFFFSCWRKSDDCVWQTVASQHMSFNLHEMMVFVRGNLVSEHLHLFAVGLSGQMPGTGSFYLLWERA